MGLTIKAFMFFHFGFFSSELSISYCYLSDDLLFLLACTVTLTLTQIVVWAGYVGRVEGRTSSRAWRHLVIRCPRLGASFAVKVRRDRMLRFVVVVVVVVVVVAAAAAAAAAVVVVDVVSILVFGLFLFDDCKFNALVFFSISFTRQFIATKPPLRHDLIFHIRNLSHAHLPQSPSTSSLFFFYLLTHSIQNNSKPFFSY